VGLDEGELDGGIVGIDVGLEVLLHPIKCINIINKYN
jgi:hypothetical protein